LPATIIFPAITVNKKTKVVCLDAPGIRLSLANQPEGAVLSIPAKLKKQEGVFHYAIVFKVTVQE
jgi:hypothetical protein